MKIIPGVNDLLALKKIAGECFSLFLTDKQAADVFRDYKSAAWWAYCEGDDGDEILSSFLFGKLLGQEPPDHPVFLTESHLRPLWKAAKAADYLPILV